MRNRVFLEGVLLDSPSVRQTHAGAYVCSFFVSVRRSADINDNIFCEAWGNTALFLSRSVEKGTSVDIEGSLRVRKKFDEKENKNRFEQFVRIETIELSENHG